MNEIILALGCEQQLCVSQIQNEEDGSNYPVWRLDFQDRSCILKCAKGEEADNYRRYLSEPSAYAPQLYATATVNDTEYLLMEYIAGHDLKKANRQDLTLVLDALIAMQKRHWMEVDSANRFDRFLAGRRKRSNFLGDDQLERAYDAYLADFISMPRSLCHDDLLPFNVIVSQGRAVLIDWEVAGILPYPTSLARLIAHCEDNPDAFFFMTEEDRLYAIDYYYSQFARSMGIKPNEFERALELCLLYEYCEWIYVGNQYNHRDDRFHSYLEKAKCQATKLGF